MTRGKYWILKSEPAEYSFDDLMAEKDRTTPWDGIRNYQARNMIRDEMSIGDTALFYHSGKNQKEVVGLAKIASEAYPDPSQFQSSSRYFDAKSSLEDPRWLCRSVRGIEPLAQPVPLSLIKSTEALAKCRLVARGNRLSVFPITKAEFEAILSLARRD
jgi:predicted RNA-binding protein with PUA-like domain